VHAASVGAVVGWPPARPPLLPPATPIGHAQFQVGGQSVSTLHAPVGCATQVLHVIDEHVLASVGFRLTLGGTTGGRMLAHGTLTAIA